MERVVIGVGLRPGAGAAAVRDAVTRCLGAIGDPQVAAIVTVDSRTAHPALTALAAELDVEVTGLSAERLAAQPVSQPSGRVAAAVGTPSVAEAAVLAMGGDLLVPKTAGDGVTVAIGRLPDLRHHGDAELRCGDPAGTGEALVDLAVNVPPGGPPTWLLERLTRSLAELGHYPDPRAATAAVAGRHGRDPDEVLLTAGGAEAFVLLARALSARRVRPRLAAVVHPQFTEPEAALRAVGIPVHRLLLPHPFTLDPALIPDEADLVIVGNPTNPTCVLHPAAGLAALARPGRILMVDEAFMDAVPGEPESLAGLGLPGLLVVRSLTKTWALPGLRIGYLLGDPPLLAELAAAQPLWAVSTPALVAAEACCEPAARAEARQRAEELDRHRDHLLGRLAGSPRLDVVPAARGPFVLFRGPAGLHAQLRRQGWATRRADTFPGLGPGWLRVAVRAPEITDAFVEALTEAVDPGRRSGAVDQASTIVSTPPEEP